MNERLTQILAEEGAASLRRFEEKNQTLGLGVAEVKVPNEPVDGADKGIKKDDLFRPIIIPPGPEIPPGPVIPPPPMIPPSKVLKKGDSKTEGASDPLKSSKPPVSAKPIEPVSGSEEEPPPPAEGEPKTPEPAAPQPEIPAKTRQEYLFEKIQEALLRMEGSRRQYAIAYEEKEDKFKKLLRILPIKKFRDADEVPEVKEFHEIYLKDFQNYADWRTQLADEKTKKGAHAEGELEKRAVLFEILGMEAVRLIKEKQQAGKNLRAQKAEEGRETGWDSVRRYGDKWADWWNKKVPPKTKLKIAGAMIGVGMATGVGIPISVGVAWRSLGGIAAGKGWYDRGMAKFEAKQEKRIGKKVDEIMKDAEYVDKTAPGIKADFLSLKIRNLNNIEDIRSSEQEVLGKQRNLMLRSSVLGGVIVSGQLGTVLRGTFGFAADHIPALGAVRDATVNYTAGAARGIKNFFGGGQSAGIGRGMTAGAAGNAAMEATANQTPGGIKPPANLPLEQSGPGKAYAATIPPEQAGGGKAAPPVLPEAPSKGGAIIIEDPAKPKVEIPPVEEIRAPKMADQRVAGGKMNSTWKMTRDMLKSRAEEMGFGKEGPANYKSWLEWKTASIIKDSGGAEAFERIKVGDKINLIFNEKGQWRVGLESGSGSGKASVGILHPDAPQKGGSVLADEPKRPKTGRVRTGAIDTAEYDKKIKEARMRGAMAEERRQFAREGQKMAEKDYLYQKSLDPGRTAQLVRSIFENDYHGVDAQKFVDDFRNPIHGTDGSAPTWQDIQKGRLRKEIVSRLVEKYGQPVGKVQDWLINRVSPEDLQLIRQAAEK